MNISIELSQHDPKDDRLFIVPVCENTTKIKAVIGANSSGKTAQIKSMAFLDVLNKLFI